MEKKKFSIMTKRKSKQTCIDKVREPAAAYGVIGVEVVLYQAPGESRLNSFPVKRTTHK